MKVQARVRLNLKKQNNRLYVVYNTFVKSTFDQYLVSSIILHSINEKDAYKYIDDLTGKGSLNNHFKTLYVKFVEKFTKDQLESIMSNSMIPKEQRDEYSYNYFPELNTSFMKRVKHSGNLGDDKEFPKQLVKSGEYVGSSVIEGIISEDSNMYQIEMNENQLKVKIDNNWLSIDIERFQNCVVHEVKNLDRYSGEIKSEVHGNNWNLLTQAKVNDISNAQTYFFKDGNHYMITNKYLRKTEMANIWGMYLYKEYTIDYSQKNGKYCELVLEELYNSKRINEFKTKGILSLLQSVNYDLVQKYLNYLLKRKDSKDLALLGIQLIDKGYEKGWQKDSVHNFKKFAKSNKDISLTYKVDSKLEYSLSELLAVFAFDKTLLSKEDEKIVQDHFDNRNSMIEYIDSILGKIAGSGRRDDEKKKLNVDNVTKEYRKLGNDLIGHTKKNVRKLNDDALEARYKKVQRFKVLDDKVAEKLKNLKK